MAIDYNKLILSPKPATAQKTGIDYNKLILGKVAPKVTPKISTIPEFLGGGAYYNPTPGKLTTAPRTTYGGVAQTQGQERDDIVPVSLGGANISKKNIRLEPLTKTGKTVTDPIEEQAAADYKSGKISLGEARMRVLIAKQRQQDKLRTTTSQQVTGALGDAAKTVGDFAMGLLKPFIKGGEAVKQGAQAVGSVGKAKIQQLSGDIEGSQATLQKEAQRLTTERAKPMTVAGTEIQRMKTMKDAVGTALEVLSYGIGGGEALAAKNIIKTTLTEGLKIGATQVAKRLAIGGAAMSLYSGGAAMQENKSAKEVAIEAAKGFPIGMAFEVGMLGAGAAGAVVFKSFQNVVRGFKPSNILERIAAQEGEEMFPKTIKIGEEIKNYKDPMISYEKAKNLGVDDAGEKILSRTEINPKTGEAKVFIDKSLDNTPGRKALILEHENNRIIEGRINPAKVESQTALNKSLEDFGIKLGKPTEVISRDLAKESEKFGGLKGAMEKYQTDPVIIKKEAPTVAALLEHQTNPSVQIHTTSAADLIKTTTDNIEKLKIETPKIAEPVTPRASKRLEQRAIEKDLLKSIPDLPEREVAHIKDQAAEYAKLSTDRALSERVAMGLEDAPGKLKSSYVWVQEANKAAREGNVEMIQKLARSPLATKFSEEGSSIRMLREMDHSNPVSVIKKINEDKAKKFVKSGELEKTKITLKKEIAKVMPKKEDWASFIESIKC